MIDTIKEPTKRDLWEVGYVPLARKRYLMATTALHLMGDISRDEADICFVHGENGDDWVGGWISGYGMIHVKFPKATTRRLTVAEAMKYGGRVYGIEGGLTYHPLEIDTEDIDFPATQPTASPFPDDERPVLALDPSSIKPLGNGEGVTIVTKMTLG